MVAERAPQRNVRDLDPVIDLVRQTAPERTDVIAQLSDLRDRVCPKAMDCRLCHASVPCERLLVRAFAGNWGRECW